MAAPATETKKAAAESRNMFLLTDLDFLCSDPAINLDDSPTFKALCQEVLVVYEQYTSGHEYYDHY